jgi:hypothetical protein
MTEYIIQRALLYNPEDSNPPGLHNALDTETESALIAMLLNTFQCDHPMNNKELLKAVREKYNSELIKSWIHSFIGRHLDVLQECRSFFLEDARLTVLRKQLQKHIDMMKTVMASKYSQLVFNPDEIDASEWEDRKLKKIIAPRFISSDEVFHAISRTYHRVTLLSCVSAAGDALTPLMISGPPARDSLQGKD